MDSSDDQICRAYHKLAMQCHPDKWTNNPLLLGKTKRKFQEIQQAYSGLGPATLVGSAAFDVFPIHAVCVVVPKVGEVKKISDFGVWIVELFWSFWVWAPNIITLLEALLTVMQFRMLLLHAYAQDMRWPYISLPLERIERPVDWVPVEVSPRLHVRMEKMISLYKMIVRERERERDCRYVFHPLRN